jgi:hypothetical protein
MRRDEEKILRDNLDVDALKRHEDVKKKQNERKRISRQKMNLQSSNSNAVDSKQKMNMDSFNNNTLDSGNTEDRISTMKKKDADRYKTLKDDKKRKMELHYENEIKNEIEKKRKHAEVVKNQYHSNPDIKSKHAEVVKKQYHKNPHTKLQYEKNRYDSNTDIKSKHAELVKNEYHSNPDIKSKHAEVVKEQYHKNPHTQLEYKKKQYDNNPDVKSKHAEVEKKQYHKNPDIKNNRRINQRKTRQSKGPVTIISEQTTFYARHRPLKFDANNPEQYLKPISEEETKVNINEFMEVMNPKNHIYGCASCGIRVILAENEKVYYKMSFIYYNNFYQK